MQRKITVGDRWRGRARAGQPGHPDRGGCARDRPAETVEVLPGEYTCIDAVHLRSGVRLVGSGEKTVLRNGPGFCTSVRVDADYGQYKVTPKDASGFRPGMRVYVRDDGAGGWLESTATIERIDNGALYLDKHLMMDYAMARNATVSNAGALISAIDAVDVRIENLVVDGNRNTHQKAGGCRIGGIYLHRVKQATLTDLLVRDFAGDGISFQITQDVSLSHVRATKCSQLRHSSWHRVGPRADDGLRFQRERRRWVLPVLAGAGEHVPAAALRRQREVRHLDRPQGYGQHVHRLPAAGQRRNGSGLPRRGRGQRRPPQHVAQLRVCRQPDGDLRPAARL